MRQRASRRERRKQSIRLQTEKSTAVTKKMLLELINEYSEAARYKINMQKTVVLKNINNELSGKHFKEADPFTIVSLPSPPPPQ